MVRGRAFEGGRGLPFGLLLDVLRSLLTSTWREEAILRLDAVLADLILLMPALVGWLGNRHPAQPASGDGPTVPVPGVLIAVIDRLVSLGPMLVLLEDLHWADDASLDAVLHLARGVDQTSGVLVMTHRPNESRSLVPKLRTSLDRERLAIDIALEPLGQTDVESMVMATLEGRHIVLSPDLLERIVRLAEGNPFFVEEILRTLLADGAQPSSNLRVPRTVHDAVQQRVEDWLRLPAARRPWPR